MSYTGEGVTTENRTTTTLTRVREAQDSLDRARVAMDSVQTGLSAVESVAEKAESVRNHPVRTGALVFLVASALLGVLLGVKSSAQE